MQYIHESVDSQIPLFCSLITIEACDKGFPTKKFCDKITLLINVNSNLAPPQINYPGFLDNYLKINVIWETRLTTNIIDTLVATDADTTYGNTILIFIHELFTHTIVLVQDLIKSSSS